MTQEYLTLEAEGMIFQVKFDDEGVVLDVFKNDEVVATTWELYSELGLQKIEEAR